MRRGRVVRARGKSGMTQLLLTVSAPRMGTNLLDSVLRGFASACCVHEMFNCWGSKVFPVYVAELYGIGKDAVTKEQLDFVQKTRRNDPEALFEHVVAIAEERGKTVVNMKIFPDYISDKFRDHLLDKHHPVCIIMHRKPIDVYISFGKAKLLGKYHSVNTTDMKSPLNAQHYRLWKRNTQRHYYRWFRALGERGLAYTVLGYDDLVNAGRQRHALVADALRSKGLELGPYEHIDSYAKQDRNAEPGERVTNWEQFLEDLGCGADDPILTRFDLGEPPLAMQASLAVERIIPRAVYRRLTSRRVQRGWLAQE
jgi:hypothetical protein